MRAAVKCPLCAELVAHIGRLDARIAGLLRAAEAMRRSREDDHRRLLAGEDREETQRREIYDLERAGRQHGDVVQG